MILKMHLNQHLQFNILECLIKECCLQFISQNVRFYLGRFAISIGNLFYIILLLSFSSIYHLCDIIVPYLFLFAVLCF